MYRTGEKAPATGTYEFDGYLDGTQTPQPTAEERTIQLTKDETFPPIRSAGKSCRWKKV